MEWLHLFLQGIILFSGFGLWISGFILAVKYRTPLITGLLIVYTCLSLRIAINILLGFFYQVDIFYEWLITHPAGNAALLTTCDLVNQFAVMVILLLLPFLLRWYLQLPKFKFLFLLTYGWLVVKILLRGFSAGLMPVLLPGIVTAELLAAYLLLLLHGLVFLHYTTGRTFIEKGFRMLVLLALVLYLPCSLTLNILDTFRILSITPLLFIYFRSLGFFCLTTCSLVVIIYHLTHPATGNREPVLLADFAVRYQLSRREQDVYRQLMQNQSYKEIAASLFISLDTVKSHVKSIYRKTGTGNRLELLKLRQQG